MSTRWNSDRNTAFDSKVELRRQAMRKVFPDGLPENTRVWMPYCGDGLILGELREQWPPERVDPCDIDAAACRAFAARFGVTALRVQAQSYKFPTAHVYSVADLDPFVNPMVALQRFLDGAQLHEPTLVVLTDGGQKNRQWKGSYFDFDKMASAGKIDRERAREQAEKLPEQTLEWTRAHRAVQTAEIIDKGQSGTSGTVWLWAMRIDPTPRGAVTELPFTSRRERARQLLATGADPQAVAEFVQADLATVDSWQERAAAPVNPDREHTEGVRRLLMLARFDLEDLFRGQTADSLPIALKLLGDRKFYEMSKPVRDRKPVEKEPETRAWVDDLRAGMDSYLG